MIDIIPQQILVPKKVFIGDFAELQCSFKIENSTLSEMISNTTIEVPIDSFSSQPEYTDCVINKIQLSQMGANHYKLVITFVPWKTGELQLPPLYINDVSLIFQPIQIVSIIEQHNASTIQEPLSPLLLPGTSYKLYGALLVLIIFIIILIELIIKRKSVSFFINNLKLQIKYKKNKKKTIKNLKKLPTKKDSARLLQLFMRNYLEVRFDFPFTKSSTSELMNNFLYVTQNLLGEIKNEAFSEIVSVFIRTDFIRYSKDGMFEKDELFFLINKLITNINILESVNKKGENNA